MVSGPPPGSSSRPRNRSCFGNLAAEALEGDVLGLGASTDAGVERVEGRDLVAAELEIEDVEVLRDPGGLGGLRNRGAALLEVPAQHHLSRGLVVSGRDLQDRGILERALPALPVGGDAADRRPGLGEDAVLGVQRLQLLLLEVRAVRSG